MAQQLPTPFAGRARAPPAGGIAPRTNGLQSGRAPRGVCTFPVMCREIADRSAFTPVSSPPMASFHLAQLNIAIPHEPLDSPRMRDFMDALDPVNAVADGTPGFVWRLQTDEGNATSLRAFGDDRLMLNMSVWESLGSLRAFVYSSREHLDVMRRRREWFEKMAELFLVLWWVEAGHIPTIPEAEERLTLLRAIGPSPDAFTFRRHFPPPVDANGAAEPVDDDRDLCPAG